MLDILKECEGAGHIGISGHIRPDGDCVGACLSLWKYLKNALPESAEITVYLDKPPKTFELLNGYDDIVTDCSGALPAHDVYFVLDSVPDRIGDPKKYFDAAVKKINIDHHISNEGGGDINHMRPEIGSVCEVLYDLYDKRYVDEDVAKAVYIGMIHDTGVFQYSSTTPDTLRKASELIAYGFDFSRIIEETFYQKTYIQSQIMGRCLMESVRFMHGHCIVSVIDKKTMDFYGVGSEDFEGIVNQLRNIKGTDCAIFMYSVGVMEYKVSIRTTDNVDAAKVVSHFGGGGHAKAAGCNMKGTYHDCVNNISVYIEEELIEHGVLDKNGEKP